MFALLALSFMSRPAFSAWTQAKGHAYNQLSFSYYLSEKKYSTLSGGLRSISQPKFEDYKLTYYGEYGVTNSLTVFTSIPYVRIKSEDVKKETGDYGPNGVGDIDLGARYKLSDNIGGTGILMSVQGTVKIPEAYEFRDPAEFEVPVEFQALGSGQYDAQLSLLFGKGFAKGYVVVNTGYRYRFENHDYDHFKPSDQLKIRVDGGYSVHPKVSLRGSIDWTKSVGNASVSRELVINNDKFGGASKVDGEENIIKDALSLESDILTLGAAVAYSFAQKWQTVISYTTDIKGFGDFGTRDSGKGEAYSIALVYLY